LDIVGAVFACIPLFFSGVTAINKRVAIKARLSLDAMIYL
jgi:hypothetical protein